MKTETQRRIIKALKFLGEPSGSTFPAIVQAMKKDQNKVNLKTVIEAVMGCLENGTLTETDGRMKLNCSNRNCGKDAKSPLGIGTTAEKPGVYNKTCNPVPLPTPTPGTATKIRQKCMPKAKQSKPKSKSMKSKAKCPKPKARCPKPKSMKSKSKRMRGKRKKARAKPRSRCPKPRSKPAKKRPKIQPYCKKPKKCSDSVDV